MNAKIIAIGTSKGIRIPKYLLDKYQFEELVDIDDTGSGLLIQPVRQTRAGWDEAFKKIAGTQDDKVIDLPKSDWDDTEWEW